MHEEAAPPPSPSPLARQQISQCMELENSQLLQFSRIGCGEGFVGCLWRGQWDPGAGAGAGAGAGGNDAIKRTFVAKTIAPFSDDMPPPLVAFFQAVQPHRRECSLYSLLQLGSHSLTPPSCFRIGANTTKNCGCIPACFGVTEGDNGNEKMLLMEDLNNHFSPAFTDGLNMQQCLETVSKLAQFHACTKAKLSTLSAADCQVYVPWSWDPVSDEEIHGFADALQGKLSAGAETFLRIGGAKYLTERCCAPYDQSLPPVDDCIIHGGHLMLGPPAVDIAVLLCTSASAELRRGKQLVDLLQQYSKTHSLFSGEGEDIMTETKYTAALCHALHLIVLSYETWTSNFNSDILLSRFASVVEDIANLVTN